MGMLGPTLFLQETCPEVIKYLPDHLCSLSGKIIVIDGMLIMQHFHFVLRQTPHCHCHVLGWYRLIK
ncbi:hypothetical protein L208DRAFT_1316259 [Tricholoma matsutake]|nr:hypothetical protein L208DRAFT_1316259 [Tricholoma matsutake 945]